MTAVTAPPIQSRTHLAYPVALIGIASFSLMDAVMKALTLELGAFNAMFWRSVIALALIAPFFLRSGARWPGKAAMKLHLMRGSIAGVMAFTFFWGIARVPLAEGIALSFVAPLIAIYLSAFFLREKVRPGALVASLISLSGVFVIAAARASGAFSSEALWGLGSIMVSAMLYACNIVLMRAQAQAAQPVEIAFWQNLVVAVQLTCLAPFFAFVPSGDQLMRMTGAASLTLFALLTLAWAYARGQTQSLVSTEYTAFIWASLFGWLWFSEAVSLPTVAGCGLIIAGCLMATRSKE
jgi:S-adenosylmethionine uptake transporter